MIKPKKWYSGRVHLLQRKQNVAVFTSVLCHCVIKQTLSKDVASRKDELKKLGRELDLTEQTCSALQQNFNEYCPNIRRQENQVKNLKDRYTNVNNQLQDRWEENKTKSDIGVTNAPVCCCNSHARMYCASGLLSYSKQPIKTRISRMQFSHWTFSWSICLITRSHLLKEWQK